tara:strand:- start:585 stop:1271 length:687 start_codon:yes stop_codon:yes gene_type:complete
MPILGTSASLNARAFGFIYSGESQQLIIGQPYQGGFFAGYISHTENGVPTHGLIVAPRASGYNGIGRFPLQWKTSNTPTAGTTSSFDGAINSSNMNNAIHPAAQYCEGLTIGGYNDWYLPARYELDIAYQNLKPGIANNSTSWGINPYSVPKRTVNRTAGVPAQTSLTSFQYGADFEGEESFIVATHWSSSQFDTSFAWLLNFSNGDHLNNFGKNTNNYVRAFRKFAL